LRLNGRSCNSSGEKKGTFEELKRDNILVFGCRKKTADFYYQEEWKLLQQSGRVGLMVAFSRDQWHKVYVQQILGSANYRGEQLARHILDKKGAVYVAGGPKMARDVKEKIVEHLAKHMTGGKKEAQHMISKLQRVGRFNVEAWN
jgi:sulfite reductase alpha subunit-like flavoprotein